MDSLTPEQAEKARKIESLLLQALANVGQKQVAEACGISESTVSRWKDGDLARTAASLVAMGLKVVPEDAETIRAEDLQALLHGHREWANSITSTSLINRAAEA